MLEKVNIWRIIVDHLGTLRVTGSNSASSKDIALFFGIPAATAIILMLFFGLNISAQLGNTLFTGLSIFAGLLFNLLVLVYDIVNRENKDVDRTSKRGRRRLRVLREVFSNISYAILVALAVVFLVGLLNLAFSKGLLSNEMSQLCNRLLWLCKFSIVKWILEFSIFTLSINFTLTLLMVLRRVHFLLSKEFEDNSSS